MEENPTTFTLWNRPQYLDFCPEDSPLNKGSCCWRKVWNWLSMPEIVSGMLWKWHPIIAITELWLLPPLEAMELISLTAQNIGMHLFDTLFSQMIVVMYFVRMSNFDVLVFSAGVMDPVWMLISWRISTGADCKFLSKQVLIYLHLRPFLTNLKLRFVHLPVSILFSAVSWIFKTWRYLGFLEHNCRPASSCWKNRTSRFHLGYVSALWMVKMPHLERVLRNALRW